MPIVMGISRNVETASVPRMSSHLAPASDPRTAWGTNAIA